MFPIYYGNFPYCYDGKLQELNLQIFKETVSFRVTKWKIAITDRIYFAMIEKEGLVGANFVRRHVFSMTGLTTDSNFSPTFFVPIWSSLENPG